MSKKQNKKINDKKENFPYSNEVKLMKQDFKKMVDEMPDEEFIDFYFSLIEFSGILNEENIEELWAEDEGWEDEALKFYDNQKNISNFPIKDNDDLPF